MAVKGTLTSVADAVVFPPLVMAGSVPGNVVWYAFAQEGSRSEPTRGQIWPRIG